MKAEQFADEPGMKLVVGLLHWGKDIFPQCSKTIRRETMRPEERSEP
jgi:hypothetical protein